MTTDHDKLRELAEALVNGPSWPTYGDNPTPVKALIQACSPSTILSLLAALEAATERAEMAERERDEARAERDARPDIRTLPTEYVCGEWIMSGQAEPDAVVTYASEPSPETGHVGWCWWARGQIGDARDYMAAREAAEKALRAHAAKAKVTT